MVSRDVNIWQPTQSVDGSTGEISWRVFRYTGVEGRITREYGKTENKGVLEFVNKEQAQSVCDGWNDIVIGDYVADDSGEIRVRRGEKWVKNRKDREGLMTIFDCRETIK